MFPSGTPRRENRRFPATGTSLQGEGATTETGQHEGAVRLAHLGVSPLLWFRFRYLCPILSAKKKKKKTSEQRKFP